MNRLNYDTYTFLNRYDWWKPINPSTNESNPYYGSRMTTVFNPKAIFASVIVEERHGNIEKVQLAFGVKYEVGTVRYTPLQNDEGGLVFEGYTGSEIILPGNTPEVFAFAMFIINPPESSSYRMSFYGCFGKCQILGFARYACVGVITFMLGFYWQIPI